MDLFDSPFVIFAASLVAQWFAAYAGDFLHRKMRPLKEEERPDFEVVRTTALTLLGLLIGFSFSMAVSRYDQRKNYEEAEANAIGTEYVRADFLSDEGAMRLRELLRNYVDQRIAFYLARDPRQLGPINAATEKVQAELWSTVVHAITPQQTAVQALAVSGMNDVLNSQGYTQAAWWNRIPTAAWALMGIIAISCNLLFGFSGRHTSALASILPFIVSIAFFLIADIDSPRGGVIRVLPQNLVAVSKSMMPP